LGEADYLTSLYEERESSTLPNLSDQNFYQEIKSCVSALRIGLDAFAIDVTCPELGIPAVYVFIPGAHFMDRTRENSVAYHASRLASQLRDEDRALAEMQRLVQLFPERYEVRFFLGYAFERKGLFELALSHFEASLQMDPKPVDVANIYCHMGIVHQARGAYQKAIQMYKVAREHNGALKEVYQQLGFCYFKKGEYEKAIEQFARALEIDPGSAIDYANIGANLKAMGYVQMAIPIYEMALEMDPSLEFARTQLEQIREMNP
jgi:ribosomal protein S12 methylthiotransferase accessory factor